MTTPSARPLLSPVLAAALAVGCAGSPRPAATPVPAARPGVAWYDGIVAIEPSAGAIDARWRIVLSSDALRGDSATFLLNDGLVVSRLGGADVLGYSRATAEGTAHLTVRFAPQVS